MKPKPNTRHKPLRSHGRRRYPLARAMVRMGLLSAWGWVHPTKGYRMGRVYERYLRSVGK